tara:strand:+ start:202 stop:1971 length:1770 start_codon:yes stop_codon:yes gene_type:complete
MKNKRINNKNNKLLNKQSNKLLTKLFLSYLSIIIVLFIIYLSIISNNKGIGSDPGVYAATAKNILSGKGITNDFIFYYYEDYNTITHSEDLRIISMPILISLSYKVFGINVFATKIINVLMFLIFAIVLYQVTKKIFNEKTAFFSSLIIIFSPYIFFSYYFLYAMTEPIFYTLLLLDIYFFTKFITTFNTDKFKSSTVFFLSLFLALTFLQRYVGIFIIFSVTAQSMMYFFGLNKFRTKTNKTTKTTKIVKTNKIIKTNKTINTYKKKFVISIILILIIFAILISPYILRNYTLFNSFISPEFSGQTDLISKCRGMPHPINNMIRYMVNQDISCSLKNVIYSTSYQIYHFFTNILTIFLFISAIILLYLRKKLKLGIRIYFDFSVLIFYLLSIFFTIRSHYEPRYFTPVFVLFFPLIVYSLLNYFKKLPKSNIFKKLFTKSKYLTLIITIILIIIFSFYSITIMNHRLSSLPTYNSYSDEADWVLQNTNKDDNIMTFIPAQVNFYTSRKTVMLPDNDINIINKLTKMYNIKYIIINQNKFNDKTKKYLYINQITESDFNSIQFFKIYENTNNNLVVFTNQCPLFPTCQT